MAIKKNKSSIFKFVEPNKNKYKFYNKNKRNIQQINDHVEMANTNHYLNKILIIKMIFYVLVCQSNIGLPDAKYEQNPRVK